MFIKTICYYFWDVFNTIYLSPLYFIVTILLEIYILQDTSIQKRFILFLNVLTFYLNIMIATLLEWKIGLGIGMHNILHNYQGTRVMNGTIVVISLIKLIYYYGKIKNNRKETIIKLTFVTIAMSIIIFLIEYLVLTGHYAG